MACIARHNDSRNRAARWAARTARGLARRRARSVEHERLLLHIGSRLIILHIGPRPGRIVVAAAIDDGEALDARLGRLAAELEDVRPDVDAVERDGARLLGARIELAEQRAFEFMFSNFSEVRRRRTPSAGSTRRVALKTSR